MSIHNSGEVYADVHVGIVALDPINRPASDLLEVMRGHHRTTVCETVSVEVIIDGDGFTEWGETWGDGLDPFEPIHVVVRISRPHDEDGVPADVPRYGNCSAHGVGHYLEPNCDGFTETTPTYTKEARERYAQRARDAVLTLLAHYPHPDSYRLADYVAVDFDPTWGEDSMVIGRWA